MSAKKLSNISNSTPSDAIKKTASARSQLITIVVGTGIFLGACFALLAAQQQAIDVRIGDSSVRAQVAADAGARTKGLSGTTSLGVSEGMLFVFPHDARWRMWMQDMQFSIDIVWLDYEKRVVWVEHSVDPLTYPESFEPPQNARYVLELASGAANKAHIQVGAQAIFSLPYAAK